MIAVVIAFAVGVMFGFWGCGYFIGEVGKSTIRASRLMAHDNAVLRVALQKMSLSADDRRKRDLILDAFKVSLAAPLQERAAEVIGKLDKGPYADALRPYLKVRKTESC